jgi:hypothetical protein
LPCDRFGARANVVFNQVTNLVQHGLFIGRQRDQGMVIGGKGHE